MMLASTADNKTGFVTVIGGRTRRKRRAGRPRMRDDERMDETFGLAVSESLTRLSIFVLTIS